MPRLPKDKKDDGPKDTAMQATKEGQEQLAEWKESKKRKRTVGQYESQGDSSKTIKVRIVAPIPTEEDVAQRGLSFGVEIGDPGPPPPHLHDLAKLPDNYWRLASDPENGDVLRALIILYGKKKTGKSFYVKWLLYGLRDILPGGICFTDTGFNGFYQCFMPTKFIMPYDPLVLKRFLVCQIRKKNAQEAGFPVNPFAFLIMEDMAWQTLLQYDRLIQMVAFNGKHFNLLVIINSQAVTSIAPKNRANADYAIMFNQKKISEVSHLANDYLDLLGEEEPSMGRRQVLQSQYIRHYTKKRNVIVVNNNAQAGLDERDNAVWWDRAEETPEFRLGNDDYWHDSSWDEQLAKYAGRKPQTLKDAIKFFQAPSNVGPKDEEEEDPLGDSKTGTVEGSILV